MKLKNEVIETLATIVAIAALINAAFICMESPQVATKLQINPQETAETHTLPDPCGLTSVECTDE